MPSRLNTPVLTVDPAKIHEVDTRSAESLHGMWMVFSRCADYMEEGRRLENLSWRLWNLETFCTTPPTKYQQRRIERLRRDSKEGIPELSSSVESVASETEKIEAQQVNNSSSNKSKTARPQIVGEDPMLSVSRGRERHITSIGLEKMVYKIKERKSLEPIAALPSPPLSPPEIISSPSSQQEQQPSEAEVDITPRAASPQSSQSTQTQIQNQNRQQQQQQQPWELVQPHNSTESCSTTANDSDENQPPASDTSVSSVGMVKSSSIVRGFSPSHISSSYRMKTQVPTPAVKQQPATNTMQKASPAKRKGIFTLGGSSGDEESSFEDRMAIKPQRSSLTDGLHQASLSQRQASSSATPVKNRLASSTIKSIRESTTDDDEAAIETDDDEDIHESAIEDDSDWEDSVTESGRSSLDERELFQRKDSQPNLVSRPSLLTMMIHQPQQNTRVLGGKNRYTNSRSTPALQRSQTTSPTHQDPNNNEDEEEDDDTVSLTMRGPEISTSSSSRPKPILYRTAMQPVPVAVAHSPRTTRRNMLSTELTESLRRHLLWERQQKAQPAGQAAAFKRRHTALDIRGMSEEQMRQQRMQGQGQQGQGVQGQGQGQQDNGRNSSWNHYFDHGPWEYHVKGW